MNWPHRGDRLKGELCFEKDRQFYYGYYALNIVLLPHIILSIFIKYKTRSKNPSTILQ